VDTLFPPNVAPDDVPSIAGFQYLADSITPGTEAALADAIDRLPWDTSWQRRRQPYGGAYGKTGEAPPIPDWGLALAQQMLKDGLTSEPFDHMLVNEYLPGQGIALHRDYEPFGRTIASLSLLSPVVMDFRHIVSGRKEHLLLEPRSLLVLSDAARYEWEHGIAPRKTDIWHDIRIERRRRISVTFRTRKKIDAS
jgi:alkylated DNA repair dioxygenase AlkB